MKYTFCFLLKRSLDKLEDTWETKINNIDCKAAAVFSNKRAPNSEGIFQIQFRRVFECAQISFCYPPVIHLTKMGNIEKLLCARSWVEYSFLQQLVFFSGRAHEGSEPVQ